MQSRLWRAVTDFFGQQTHLKVDYDDLLAHPERQITRIIEYLGLDPDPALTRTALRSIRTRSPMAGDGNGQTPRPERKVLFDLGTHHGEGLRHLRQELSLDGTWEIHAYEANPACHVCRWLQGVPLPIQVHETAVWIRDGQVTFRQHNRRALSQGSSPDATSDVDGWASCLAELGSSHPDLEPAVEVPCEDFARLLEAYSAEDFVVVKMDVEGAEFAILRHLIKREVVQRIRRLYIEWHDHLVPTETGCTRRQLEQQLRCLGLEVLPWD
jgi:FkbM family methyltransferase